VKRLDRYVLGEIVPGSLISLGLYVFLLLMNILFDLAREAVEHGLSIWLVVRLLYYQMPELLVVCLPMSILLGCLIGVGRLSGDGEILAIQSAGVSPRRLLLPIGAWGLSGALLCFFFLAVVAPEGAFLHHRLKREVYLSRYADPDRIVPRVFHDSLPGILFYYDKRGAEPGRFERVFLYDDSESGIERLTVARQGEFGFDSQTGRLTLYLEQGATHARKLSDRISGAYSVTAFRAYQEGRDAPAYIKALSGAVSRNQDEMSLGQLRQEIAKAAAETNPIVRTIRLAAARTAFQERFALPAACFVFSLLALPLGLRSRRGGKAAGFALSLAVLLVYWVLYSVMKALSESGRIDPLLGLWIPNLVFLGAALTLLSRRRAPSLAQPRFQLRFAKRAPSFSLRAPIGVRSVGADPAQVASRVPSLRRFPLLIDRYVASIYARVLAFVMLAVLCVYLLVEFRQVIRRVLETGAPMALVWRYLALATPRMVLTVLPVACLVATVVGLGLMTRTRETTALRAAGLSLHRLLASVLALTGTACVLGALAQEEVLPATNRAAAELRDTLSGNTPRTRDPRHRWVFGRDSRLYHYESEDASGGIFQGFSIFELDPETFALLSRTYSDRARYDGRTWVLENVTRRTFTSSGSEVVSNDRLEVALPVTPAFFASEESVLTWGVQREPGEMSFRDELQYVRDLEERGYDTVALRVALAQKATIPFVPLGMVLLGFPFSFGVGARGVLFGVGVAIGLCVLYWSALAVFNALGSAGILAPWLSATAPHVFFGGLGLYLSLRVRT
jgi:lipopolysaccharide export system permease protein